MPRRHSHFWKVVHEYPFGVLLIALFVMIVGAPITAEVARHMAGIQGAAGLAPLTILLTLASAYAVWQLARYRAMVIFAAGIILVLLGLSSFELGRLGLAHLVPTGTFNVVHVLSQTLFLVYVTSTLLRTVFRAKVVDGNILCGAACIYLLAGVVWGYAYTLLDYFQADSFKVTDPDVNLADQPGWLVYFSFTTLTTVGFGDVLPAKALARSLSVLEAVIGQIMLVVMMARLVGLHVAHATSSKSHPVEFSTDEG